MRKPKKNKNEALDNLISQKKIAGSDCPHFEECGGCYMRQISYEDQLDVKSGALKELFEPVLGEKFEKIYEGIFASPEETGYRNKMEFSFGDMDKEGPLTLGLHKRGSFYDILPVPECRIVDEDFRLILSSTLEFFREKRLSYFHKRTHRGYLRHLIVRKAVFTGEILVDLVTGEDYSIKGDPYAETVERPVQPEGEMLEEYAKLLCGLSFTGKLCGVLRTRNTSVADAVIDEGTEIIYGESYFYEKLLDLKFKITPFSFFQTNSKGAEVLYGKAREYLLSTCENENGLGNVLYDLYSGTGTIAQIMSPAAGKVVGVEIVEEAVLAAKENAALNGIENCSFLAGDVLKVIDEVEEKPDCIILDPPRDGIHPKALPKIIDYGVDHILYIACKPKSLARDLPAFMEAGYEPVRMCAVDMFPGTQHVECVVLLSRV